MAGALTANAVEVRLGSPTSGDEPASIADIALLSPVDGANNVLLTGVVTVLESDEVDVLTLQWYRAGIASNIHDDDLGTAVGDPFVIDCSDSELEVGPITVQAIDRGAGLTSAYALAESSEDQLVTVTAVYVDAVLYD